MVPLIRLNRVVCLHRWHPSTEDLAGLDREADPAKRLNAAEPARNAVEAQKAHRDLHRNRACNRP